MSRETRCAARWLQHVPGVKALAAWFVRRDPEMARQVRANLLREWPEEELRAELQRRHPR